MSLLRHVLRAAEQKGHQLLTQSSGVNLQQLRTTVVVKRTKEFPLTKEGYQPRVKSKHRIYEVVENKAWQKAPKIKVILTDYVEGLGDKGEVLDIKAKTVRMRLFPAGLAVYASPENLAELKTDEEEQDKPKMSAFSRTTIRKLSGMNLVVPMNAEIPWEINKSHIRVAFRKLGVEVPEEAITLPDEPVCEPTQFQIGVTVNNMETVTVNTVIQPLYKDPVKNAQFVRPQIFTNTLHKRESTHTES